MKLKNVLIIAMAIVTLGLVVACSDEVVAAKDNNVAYTQVLESNGAFEYNGTKYETLQDAIEAIDKAKGYALKTIKVLRDVNSDGATVPATSGITLNLNGKKLSFLTSTGVTTNGVFNVEGEGEVTFAEGVTNGTAFVVNKGGNLTVTNTIINVADQNAVKASGVGAIVTFGDKAAVAGNIAASDKAHINLQSGSEVSGTLSTSGTGTSVQVFGKLEGNIAASDSAAVTFAEGSEVSGSKIVSSSATLNINSAGVDKVTGPITLSGGNAVIKSGLALTDDAPIAMQGSAKLSVNNEAKAYISEFEHGSSKIVLGNISQQSAITTAPGVALSGDDFAYGFCYVVSGSENVYFSNLSDAVDLATSTDHDGKVHYVLDHDNAGSAYSVDSDVIVYLNGHSEATAITIADGRTLTLVGTGTISNTIQGPGSLISKNVTFNGAIGASTALATLTDGEVGVSTKGSTFGSVDVTIAGDIELYSSVLAGSSKSVTSNSGALTAAGVTFGTESNNIWTAGHNLVANGSATTQDPDAGYITITNGTGKAGSITATSGAINVETGLALETGDISTSSTVVLKRAGDSTTTAVLKVASVGKTATVSKLTLHNSGAIDKLLISGVVNTAIISNVARTTGENPVGGPVTVTGLVTLSGTNTEETGKSTISADSVYSGGFYKNGASTLDISAGTFTGVSDDAKALYVIAGTVNISNGTFGTTAYTYPATVATYYNTGSDYGNGTIVVTGGTFYNYTHVNDTQHAGNKAVSTLKNGSFYVKENNSDAFLCCVVPNISDQSGNQKVTIYLASDVTLKDNRALDSTDRAIVLDMTTTDAAEETPTHRTFTNGTTSATATLAITNTSSKVNFSYLNTNTGVVLNSVTTTTAVGIDHCELSGTITGSGNLKTTNSVFNDNITCSSIFDGDSSDVAKKSTFHGNITASSSATFYASTLSADVATASADKTVSSDLITATGVDFVATNWSTTTPESSGTNRYNLTSDGTNGSGNYVIKIEDATGEVGSITSNNSSTPGTIIIDESDLTGSNSLTVAGKIIAYDGSGSDSTDYGVITITSPKTITSDTEFPCLTLNGTVKGNSTLYDGYAFDTSKQTVPYKTLYVVVDDPEFEGYAANLYGGMYGTSTNSVYVNTTAKWIHGGDFYVCHYNPSISEDSYGNVTISNTSNNTNNNNELFAVAEHIANNTKLPVNIYLMNDLVLTSTLDIGAAVALDNTKRTITVQPSANSSAKIYVPYASSSSYRYSYPIDVHSGTVLFKAATIRARSVTNTTYVNPATSGKTDSSVNIYSFWKSNSSVLDTNTSTYEGMVRYY